MSSVWSASMSNGGGDLACHMCLSAYKLTGRDVQTVQEESNWINSSEHWERVQVLLYLSGFQFTITPDGAKHLSDTDQPCCLLPVS